MISQESMSVVQSLMISGVGILAVFTVLVVLAIAIKLFSLFFSALEKKQTGNTADRTGCNGDIDESHYAMILSVMHEELNSEGRKYRITSIKESGGK